MTSLWPARYLVAEWMTRSAPSSSARCGIIAQTHAFVTRNNAIRPEIPHLFTDNLAEDWEKD